MRRIFVTLVCAVFIISPLFADHDKGKGVGHDKEKVIVGPPGQDGKDGDAGKDGRDGKDGERGVDGKDGINGINADNTAIEGTLHHLQETQYILQGEIRLFDSRKFGLNVFGEYDIRHTRGHQIGLGLLYKIGKSYEEKQIEKLRKMIEELKYHAHYSTQMKYLIFPELRENENEKKKK